MTRPVGDTEQAGASIVVIGVAACAACCAVPVFGLMGALVAGASVAALATGGVLFALVVIGIGLAVVAWRRRRAEPSSCASAQPVPVAVSARVSR